MISYPFAHMSIFKTNTISPTLFSSMFFFSLVKAAGTENTRVVEDKSYQTTNYGTPNNYIYLQTGPESKSQHDEKSNTKREKTKPTVR
jgi:hypothetical protein